MLTSRCVKRCNTYCDGMSEPWSNYQAIMEGWRLRQLIHTNEIVGHYQTDHVLPGYRPTLLMHQLDELALRFVQQRAAEGSTYHIEALARTHLL